MQEKTIDVDESLSALAKLDDRVRKGDAASLRARWKFGRLVLTFRQNGRLPRGVLGKWAKSRGRSRSEISARRKFAEMFPTEEAVSDVIRQYPTWFAITHKALKNPRPEPDSIIDQTGAIDPDGSDQEADPEPKKRRSFTPRLRRMLDFLQGIESADLGDKDLRLLADIAQLAGRHTEAANALREAKVCDRREAA